MFRTFLVVVLLAAAALSQALAADDNSAPGSPVPFPRIIAGGPATRVKSVVFTNRGQTLYAAGWDKLIYRWDLVEGKWTSRADGVLTVPIGGGMDGIIEAMSISPDGEWLAAGGRGVKRNVANSRQSGLEMSAEFMTDNQRLDEGSIYLFHLPTGQVKLLRGHRGAILGSSFALGSSGRLISVAESWSDKSKSFQTDLMAWDVAAGQSIGQLLSFRVGGEDKQLPPWDGLEKPPGLTAFTNDEGRLLAAIAWPDRKQEFGFRLWDVAQGVTIPLDQSRQHFYFDVDVDPSHPQDLLTCSANQENGHGVIRRWSNLASTGKVTSASQVIHDFGTNQIPTEWVSEKVDKETFGTALVVEWQNKTRTLRGLLISNNRGVPSGQISINSNYAPAAVSPTGLVAWSDPYEPCVHLGEQLAVGEPKVKLTSPTIGFQNVEFVARDGVAGLLLKPRKKSDTPLVFIPSTRTLSSDVTGWQSNALEETTPNVSINSRLENGQVILIEVKRAAATHQVRVVSNDSSAPINDKFLVRLIGSQTEKPLIITVFNQRNQPQVQVFDLISGEKLREYSAHTDTIRDLSIQKDEKLFATVGSDATVRLCWLGDLLDQREARGALRRGNQQLKLSSNAEKQVLVETDFDPLKKGDVILSMDIGAGPQAVKAPRDCFFLASQLPAEAELVIETSRGPLKTRLGRAVDIQREVLAMACAPASPQDGWDWIAWHPSGTFDYQGEVAKSCLHWHFNTGDASRPSQIVRAEKYDQEFLRTDFLQPLWETGVLPQAPPESPPKISMWLQDAQGNPIDDTKHGIPVLRSSEDVESAFIGIDTDFPISQVEGIHWSLTDSSETILAEGDAVLERERVWSLHPKLELPHSGFYALNASVIRGGKPHPTWNKSIDLRFQTPAPQLDTSKVPASTDQASLPLVISVKALADSVVRLQPKGGAEPIERIIPGGGQLVEIEAPLELGLNEFELTVTNQHALPRFESFERSRKTLVIVRSPTKPSLDQGKLLRWSMAEGASSVDLNSAESAVRFRKDTLEMSARVESKVVPEIVFDINGTPIAVKADGDGPYEVKKTVRLDAGVNQIKLRSGSHVLGSVDVVIAPDLPVLGPITVTRDFVSGDDSAESWPQDILVDGLHASVVKVQSLATGGFDPQRQRAAILLDGMALQNVSVMVSPTESGMNTLSANLEVPKGSHRLQFQVTDDLESETSPVAMIQRITPPKLLNLTEVNRKGSQIVAKMEFESTPETTVSAEQIRVSVNGSFVPLSDQASIVTESDKTIAQIVFQADPGRDNIVRGWLALDELPLMPPASLTVNLPPAAGPKPMIDVSAPQQTTQQNLPLGIRVRSDSPVLEIKVGTEVNSLFDVPEKDWSIRDGLVEIVPESIGVPLKPGVNNVFVVARNMNGETQTGTQVSFIPPPASAGRLKFVSFDKSIDFFEVDRHFGQVPSSQNKIHGQLQIPNQELTNSQVQIWVNGFLQPPPPRLERIRGKDGYEFTANVTLTRQKGNHILLHFPEDIKLPEGFRSDFKVDCDSPNASQELFVVMMDPARISKHERPRREEELRLRLRAALKAKDNGSRVSSDAFQDIRDSIVLLDKDAKWDKLRIHLQTLKLKSINPVILVYYRGNELAIPGELRQGAFGLTTYNTDVAAPPDPKTLVTEKALTEVLSGMGGAHLLVLDLVDSNQPTIPLLSPLGRDPRLGVFRFVKGSSQPSSVVDELSEALSPSSGNDRNLKNVGQFMRGRTLSSGLGFPEFHIPPALERLQLATKPE